MKDESKDIKKEKSKITKKEKTGSDSDIVTEDSNNDEESDDGQDLAAMYDFAELSAMQGTGGSSSSNSSSSIAATEQTMSFQMGTLRKQ